MMSSFWRYAGLQRIEFGLQEPFINRLGQTSSMGEYSLTMSCKWNVSESGISIISSDDYNPRNESRNLEAKWFFTLIKTEPPIVSDIVSDNKGIIAIRLNRNFTLNINPTEITSGEYWRFFKNDNYLLQYVAYPDGIHEEDCS